MDRERKARPSLVHLAAKFNTAPPPGYVPGRGRGVSGFTKPPPAPPRRGRGRRGADDAAASSNGAEVEDGAQYGDAEEEETEDAVAGADYEPDELDNSAVAFEAGGFDDEGKLKGEAGDTRALDLGGTEKFEVARTTMSQMEAGYEIEPFNMKQERLEGHFDDDFNYVWKRRGDEADAHDAWLGEVDESTEADDKVAKRRRLVAAQMAQIGKQEEEEADVPALAGRMVELLEPGESVAAALRRLSERDRLLRKQRAGKGKAQGVAGAGTSDAAAEGANGVAGGKSEFDVLTETADRLLRAGQFEVYAETRESLARLAGTGAADSSAGGALNVVASAVDASDAVASAGDASARAGEGGAMPPAGVSQEAHDAALAGGFVLDAASGCYYGSANGLWFDARSGLYWPAAGGGTYYTWNAEAKTFEPVGAAANGGGTGAE